MTYPGEVPRRLWEKLRKTGWCVEVVAVAWEQKLLDRAGRRLPSWAVGEMSEVEKAALMLRQAMAEADWDTVESHGRFNGIIREDPPMGAGNASLQWRGNDRRLPSPGVKHVAHETCNLNVIFNIHMTGSSNRLEIVFLSEGEARAVVVQALPGNPQGTGVSRVLNN